MEAHSVFMTEWIDVISDSVIGMKKVITFQKEKFEYI